MIKAIPISRSEFQHKRWKKPANYLFASEQTLCPLDAKEVPKACLCLPICFSKIEGQYTLASLHGLVNGQNLFVDGQGRWLPRYTPAEFRIFPFLLADNELGDTVLCIDETSGLVTDDEGAGEVFFDAAGNPSALISDIIKFLTETRRNREATRSILQVLTKYDLIRPWKFKYSTENGDTTVDGIYCIDEVALNRLSGVDLVAVRDIGALSVAYCQLLSMQNATLLPKILRIKDERQRVTEAPEISLGLSNDQGNITFDNF